MQKIYTIVKKTRICTIVKKQLESIISLLKRFKKIATNCLFAALLKLFEVLSLLLLALFPAIKTTVSRRHKIANIILVSILLYAFYSLANVIWDKGIGSPSVTPTLVSIAALMASIYTAWWQHWMPADVEVRVVNEKSILSEEASTALLFYNSGSSNTTVTITSVQCTQNGVEVIPTLFSDFRIPPRDSEVVDIRIRSTRGMPLEKYTFPCHVKVSYIFWRGTTSIHCDKSLTINLSTLEKN